MKEIAETGYWNGETAHLHHVHSQELSNWICEFLKKNIDKPDIIIDCGAGLGNYLKDLQNKGFKNLLGIEGDPPKNKVFSNIIKQDLTIPFYISAGNVIFLEVSEHIEQKYEKQLIDNITNICNNYLIMSWAIVDQPGFGHVNCKNNDEVIKIFENKGFKYLLKETLNARNIIKDNTWWFRDTILIFKKI